MILLQAENDKPYDWISKIRAAKMPVLSRLAGAFRMLGLAIVVATTRRKRRQNSVSASAGDVAGIPRMPLTLDHRWDF